MQNEVVFEVHGKKVVCYHCGGDSFVSRRVQLNTAVLTFFNMDYLNKSADVYVCADCGHLEWFLDPEVQVDDQSAEDA